MPKVLVIEPCAIRLDPDQNAQHHDVGDFAEVSKADAEFLCRAGRTLYTVKADDPTKAGQFTASADMLKAAKEMAKTAEKAIA